MRTLLLRTIARVRAKICLCPMESLLPPPEIRLSSVSRLSCREQSGRRENVVESRIIMLLGWIEVAPQGATQELVLMTRCSTIAGSDQDQRAKGCN